jgi:protein kinase-like protein/PEGA domain-containing protein
MIPKTLGRFEILREIGRGAMGQVFLARDPKIERQVAIKTIVLPPGTPENEARETGRRFLREAQAAGRLLHPNIVTIFDVGEDQGVSFIAMEYIDGETLDRRARPDTLLPPGEVRLLITQAAAALDHAHAAGVIHRDVKPANLMRLADGTLKITDFGLAKEPSASLTQTGVLLGTPSYMSPEQIQGRPLDGRSDLFSLGVVLYELLTGTRPFEADSISTIIYRVLYEDPRPPAVLNPGLPIEINRVIARALAKDPAHRYESGAMMVTDMTRALASLPPDSLKRPFPRPAPAAPRPATTARSVAAPQQGGSRPAAPAATGRPAGLSATRPARSPRPAAGGAPRPAERTSASLLAHHPVKITALALTVAAGLLFFPRGANRYETAGSHRDPSRSSGPIQAAGIGAGAPDTEAGPNQAGPPAAVWTPDSGAPNAAAPGSAGTPAVASGPPGARAGADGRVSVAIETRPPGGSVFLDDIPLAEPRVVLSAADPKTHDIRARSGCLEATAEKSATELLALDGPLVLELRPRRDVVAVGSEPAGARLYIDGRDTGKTTPVEIEIDACERRAVELRLAGHRSWTRTFEPKEGLDALGEALHAVTLEPIPQGTVVVARPNGYTADIYHGERRLGRAGDPLTLPEGKYTLTVRNDDVFMRATTNVTVSGGKTSRPGLVPPELGRLTVLAQPSNCKVFVDGTYLDVTPVLERPIAAGDHRVKVVFVPNGAVREIPVSVVPGRAEKVEVKF